MATFCKIISYLCSLQGYTESHPSRIWVFQACIMLLAYHALVQKCPYLVVIGPWQQPTLLSGSKFSFLQNTIEAVRILPTATILWALLFYVICIGHYAPNYTQNATHHAILQLRINAIIIETTNWATILWVLWRHSDGLYNKDLQLNILIGSVISSKVEQFLFHLGIWSQQMAYHYSHKKNKSW